MSFDLLRSAGDALFFTHFRGTLEILYLFVHASGGELTLADLERATRRCKTEIDEVCTSLIEARLIVKCAQTGTAAVWRLAPSPCSLTLEDVYRCVEARIRCKRLTRDARARKEPSSGQSAIKEVDTLMIEVQFNAHQLLLKYLRDVYVIRLRPAARHPFLSPFAFVKREQQLRHPDDNGAADAEAPSF